VTAAAAGKKAAFVAVVGRPSVGKSTLINLLCGAKVAIVSPVPQTTRNAVRGIVNREEGQLVFVDTPGLHVSERKFNKKLAEISGRAVNDSELVLYMLDASRAPGPEEEAAAGRLKSLEARTVVGINKTDAAGADCETIAAFVKERLPALPEDRFFRMSCFTKEGVEDLLACLFRMAAEGEPFYPGDIYTDQDVSFRIAEIIREKAVNRLRQELPHSIYVEVADAEFHGEDGDPQKSALWVRAFIVTERESQKGMIVGKGGCMIKAIRQAAQKDFKEIFDWKIELDLRVKTGKDWRGSDQILRRLFEHS
jgi:GTP-binding protein Era